MKIRNDPDRLGLFATMLALLCVALSARAQDLIPSAPPQSGGVMLVGGTVHTVSGETIKSGVVGFREGRITLVADASIMDKISLTPDTKIIDAKGKHVYPGLFAPHTRLGLIETEAVRQTRDESETGSYTPEVRAAVAVNPDSTLIPVARLNGVLLAGVMNSGGRIPGRASIIRLDGWTWEDMTVKDDAGLIVNWPGVRPRADSWRSRPEGDEAERIRGQLDEIGRFFDKAVAYAKARRADPDRPDDMRLDAMLPYCGLGQTQEGAPASGARLLISADDYDQIVSAVSFAAGRGVRAAIVGGRDAPMCAELLKEHNVPVIVDGVYRFPKRADSPYDEAFTLPARLAGAGVRFCIGGADHDGNVRNLAYEAAMAARFGLDPDEAVRAITLSPAEILGVADDYGSIEQGKSATLIITTGDVLEIPSNVEHAWIDGRAIILESKQTELRDKYTEKYRQLGLIKD